MVFTLYHAIISLGFWVLVSSEFEIISFVLGSMLPDIESVYYAFEALKYCPANDYVCLAEYPSHYFLHSFLGITFLACIIAYSVNFLREKLGLTVVSLKRLFVSALIGGMTHLFVDLTTHRGEDALMLFFPFPERFSFVFPCSFTFWHGFMIASLFAGIACREKIMRWLK